MLQWGGDGRSCVSSCTCVPVKQVNWVLINNHNNDAVWVQHGLPSLPNITRFLFLCFSGALSTSVSTRYPSSTKHACFLRAWPAGLLRLPELRELLNQLVSFFSLPALSQRNQLIHLSVYWHSNTCVLYSDNALLRKWRRVTTSSSSSSPHQAPDKDLTNYRSKICPGYSVTEI